MEQQPLSYRLQVKICRGDKFFGPGVAQLLLLIDQYHSLQKATEQMHIAYSKAWRILREAERNIGVEIIRKKVGGAGGGGSELTDEGRDYLQRYLAFEKEVRQEADRLFAKYFLEVPDPQAHQDET